MSHSHNHHSHGKHSHHHGHNANRKALFISFGLIFAFMVIEFIGGMMTNSLALCPMPDICSVMRLPLD